MAISLKEQLGQINQLQEVSYHAPIFDKNYYDSGNHSAGRKSGKYMFYDFYAMELLWSFLGSGQIPKADREKLLGLPDDDPRRDIIISKGHRFLPSAAVRVIDSMYEQVTNTVAKNLLAYVRLAVVQEFQYLVSQSHGWTQFRNSLVSNYNKNNKTMTKEIFDKLVEKHIPQMKSYPDTIKRLLKYSKYFSEMHTTDDKDPFDISRNVAAKSTKAGKEEEPYPEFPNGPAPYEPKEPEEPDTTDYSAEPSRREFGKYGGPGQPKSPYDQDWSGTSAFKDPDEEDDEKGGEVKERLTEEQINTKKVKKVYAAINKAGITMDDIEKAYNKIDWGGAYGGPKWGAGVIALLKLADAKKNLSTEDMNHIIDHIYDLQHNTGSLLNKGPMYVDETDLNRRYKITDIARFIPFVSSVIRNMILRFQRYLHVDPAKAQIEADMENIQKSPKLPMEPDDIKKLGELGFQAAGDNSYRVAIKFKDKKGASVYGVYYEVSKHDNGTFESGKFVKIPNALPMFVVSDNLKADVKAFPTFAEAFQYVSGYKQDMVPSGKAPHEPSTIKSDKDMYIDSHTRIKLPPDKEQALLDINLGWRKNGQYYKAYFPDGHRFLFYAFSDGSFLVTHNNKSSFFVYNDWKQVYAAAQSMANGADVYPNKAQAQSEIDTILGKLIGPETTAAGAPSVPKEYHLSSGEQSDLQMLVNSALPGFVYDKYIFNSMPDGMTVISRQKYHQTSPQFAVGKLLDAIVGKPYKVVHYLGSGPTESWPFYSWADALIFIENNLSKLVNAGLAKALPISQQSSAPTAATSTPTVYSPSGKQLPPNSTSKASYSLHSGLQSVPKSTIRLTKEDEDALLSIGFEPRMVGDNIWYIHKFAGDTVKFFPNNTSKVLFTSKGSAVKVPGINGTIDKILAWLPTKYSLQTNKSPIDTGASTGVPAQTAHGIKAGVMFEKTIADAGFIWDNMANEYVDYPGKKMGGAENILKIAPDRSSVIKFYSGQIKHFKDLVSLITYLKKEYPTQKKSSSVTAKPDKIDVYPSWINQKQIGMMEKAGFQYKGPVSDSGYSYRNSGGDTIIAYPTHIYKVFDAAHNNWVDLSSSEEFTTYLGEKFGSLPSPTSEVPAASSNIMSKEEEDAIANLVDSIPGLKFNKGNDITDLTEASEKPKIQYVYISDAKGKIIFAVFKKRGKYIIYKVVGDAWDKVYEDKQFGGIEIYLGSVLKDYASNKEDTAKLSDEEKEWIDAYVKSNLPKSHVILHVDGSVGITYGDKGERELFFVEKLKNNPYTVRYFTTKYLPGYGHKFSYDTFNTFPELAAGIEKNFSTYTQLATATSSKYTTGVTYLDEKLAEYEFKFLGTTSDGGNGKKNNGVVFDDPKHNRVIYYFDGTSKIFLSGGTLSGYGADVKGNLLNLKDVHELLAFLDTQFGSLGTPISIWDHYTQLDAAGFIEETDAKGEIGYVHGTDFSFKVWPNAVQWSTSHGTKEAGFSNDEMHIFLKVLNKVTPQMKGDEIDQLFSKQTVSKKDEMFDALIEEASQLGGTGGMVSMGTNFEDAMHKLGFEWDDHNKLYLNYYIHQIVVIVNTEKRYVYYVFFIDAKGNGKREIVDHQFLFGAIGADGNLEKLKKQSGAESTPVTEPSGETYQVHTNAASDSLLKLNEHDAKLIEYCGFNFTPKENWYYKNVEGDIFKFYDTGRAEYWDSDNGETVQFNNIPHALKFAVAKYITQKPTESSSPFSNQNYNSNPTDEELIPIPLNIRDSELLEKIGFKWNPKKEWYIKKLNPNKETPALQEVGKKKKASPKKKGDYKKHMAQQFDLPLGDQEYEIIHAYNSGNATWTVTTDSEHALSETETTDGTIKEVLDFVWHRWNGNEKIEKVNKSQSEIPANPPLSYNPPLPYLPGKRLPQNEESIVIKKGFRWNNELSAYVKKFGQPDQEQINVEPTEIKYYYINAKGNTKMFSSSNPMAIINMISVAAHNKASAILYGLGYKEMSTTDYIAPKPEDTNVSSELHKDNYQNLTKEVLQLLSDGDVIYGVVTYKHDVPKYDLHMIFNSLEDAAQYLSPKSSKLTGKLVEAPSAIHDDLINIFKFTFNNGAYSKGNQKIVFDAGGIVNYYYTGNEGEVTLFSDNWKNEGIHNLMNQIQVNNPEGTFSDEASNPEKHPKKSQLEPDILSVIEDKLHQNGFTTLSSSGDVITFIDPSDGKRIALDKNSGRSNLWKYNETNTTLIDVRAFRTPEDLLKYFQKPIQEYKDIMKMLLE